MSAHQTDATETMAEPSPAPSRVGLTLVHHPNLARLGDRLEVSAGASQSLGRGSSGLAAGQLDDRTVSKRHATLSVSEASGGPTWLEDHDSRNGTRVNGVQISRAQLRVGDVVALGRIMFVVDAETRPDPVVRGQSFDAFAAQTCAILRVGGQLAPQTPRWIWGPAGAGKTTLARVWSPGHVIVVDARLPTPPAWTAEHSVIVEHANEASHASLEAICGALEATAPRSLVFTSVAAPDPGTLQRDPLTAALTWSFHLPPLSERPADIAAIAWSHAARNGDSRPLSPQLLLALQSAAWPNQAAGVCAVLQRARLESRGPDVDVFADLSRMLRPTPLACSSAHLRVADSCAWLEGQDGPRADLSRNPLLRRLLDLLVQQHRCGGAPLGVDTIFAHAWPNEQASATSRTNRVYVALTKLRKAGLKSVLERVDGGYRIAPDAAVDVVPER